MTKITEENKIQLKPWNGYDCAVSLTFDDGFESVLDTIVPLLDKYDCRGTFYINPTPSIEKKKKENPNLPEFLR